MVGNINNAKIKMLAERDLLLVITLRGRKREKRKPRVWVRQVYLKSGVSLTAVAVSLSWFTGLFIVTFTYRWYVWLIFVILYLHILFNEYILTVSLLPKCFKFLFMWIWKLVIWFVFIFTLRSEVENFQLQWLLRAWKEQRLGVDQVQSVYNQKNISQSEFLRLLQASESFLIENAL